MKASQGRDASAPSATTRSAWTNSGKSELDISSLQMFTTGLQVSLNKSKLQPGETAHLRITGMMKELRNLRAKPRVLMITNDPANPKVVIPVYSE